MQILIVVAEIILWSILGAVFVAAVGSSVYFFRTAKKHVVPASWCYITGAFQALVATAIVADVVLAFVYH